MEQFGRKIVRFLCNLASFTRLEIDQGVAAPPAGYDRDCYNPSIHKCRNAEIRVLLLYSICI